MFALRKSARTLFRGLLRNSHTLPPIRKKLIYQTPLWENNIKDSKGHDIQNITEDNLMKTNAGINDEEGRDEDNHPSQGIGSKKGESSVEDNGKSYKYSINYMNAKWLSDAELKVIGEEIASIATLQKIDLKLEGCEKLTGEGLKSLGEYFRNLNALESLHLSLEYCDQITDEGIKSLSQSLCQLTSLQDVSLIFSYAKKLTDTGLKSLSEALEKLTSLRSVNLNFAGCREISNEGFSSLLKGLKSPLLAEITLDFSSCNNMDDEALKLLSESLMQLKSLQKLDANFGSYVGIPYTDGGFVPLVGALRHLTSLKYLNLGFEKTKITDKGVVSLGETLGHLKLLRIVQFDFRDCDQISESGNGRVALIEGLKQLTCLRELSLQGRQGGEKGMESLSEALKHLKSLTKFNIDLAYHSNSDNKGAISLSESIRQLSDLEEITIKASSSDMNDKKLESFSESLSHLKRLRRIHFNLDDCWISSKAVNCLLESVRSLKSLEDINLSFAPSDVMFTYDLKISGQILKPFFEGISNFTKLESLKIGLIACHELTDQDIQLLIQTLGQVSSLKNIHLELKCLAIINEEKQNMLKEGLQHIQSLNFNIGFTRRIGGFKDGRFYDGAERGIVKIMCSREAKTTRYIAISLFCLKLNKKNKN